MGVFVADRKGDQDGMIMTIIIVILCCMNVEECCMLISCVVDRHSMTRSLTILRFLFQDVRMKVDGRRMVVFVEGREIDPIM